MDKQATQDKNHDSSAVSVDHSDKETEPLERVPVEVWVKIFEYSGTQENAWQHIEQNKALARLRSVCKNWRNIVDENTDFTISFDHRTLQEKTISHLRFKSCYFYNFSVHLPSNPILFREPTLLTDVGIHGSITRANFIWLIKQLINLNCLRLGEEFFECDDIFNPSKNQDDDALLNNSWNRLEQLHLECLHADFCHKTKTKALANLQKYMSIHMARLKHFRFVARWSVEMFRLTIELLLQNPTVDNLDISCVRVDGYIPPSKPYQADPEDIQKIQLKSLKLHMFDLSPNECGAFLPLIKAQTSMTSLKITDTCRFHTITDSLCFGDTLAKVVQNNYGSLETLDLCAGHCAGLVDGKHFQQMPFLKSLILSARHGPPNSYIANLACLPVSIETLKLKHFNHDVQDLLDMCMADTMVNLRSFSLSPCTSEIQMTPDALDSLIKKVKFRDLDLYSLFWIFLNTKLKKMRMKKKRIM